MGTIIDPDGLLSNPEDGLIDIVFVHGLQGYPRKTWTSSTNSPEHSKNNLIPPSTDPKRAGRRSPFRFLSSHNQTPGNIGAKNSNDFEDNNRAAETKGIFWPEGLLKADFPSARIMTFGYNTNIQQGYHVVNQGNIFSHAKDLLYKLEATRRQAPDRHLLFIAHSLGGILVKEVLRRSQADPDDKIKKIYKSTSGVFFFGTPHRGSRDWASFGEGLTILASRLLGIDANSQVIHALLPSGPELEICRESFASQWRERRDSLTVRTF
ncbi:hypothetical protein F5884DRAFT_874097 [Xylogone sp. PMI_703]|nr:hypothetical protein F5884DRAFT_874097 [Xylogone sp. PMI_703]